MMEHVHVKLNSGLPDKSEEKKTKENAHVNNFNHKTVLVL